MEKIIPVGLSRLSFFILPLGRFTGKIRTKRIIPHFTKTSLKGV